MATGTITSIVEPRGFGFIQVDGGGSDLFFHCKELRGLEWDGTLTERRVSFERATDERAGKPQAVNVRAAS